MSEAPKPPAELAPWEREPAAPQWQEAADDPVALALGEALGEALVSARTFAGDLTLEVRREAFRSACAALKEGHDFTLLVVLCGVDFPKREAVEVVVHSKPANRRVRVKTAVGEGRGRAWCRSTRRPTGRSGRRGTCSDCFATPTSADPALRGSTTIRCARTSPRGIDTGGDHPSIEARQGPIAGTGTGWKVKNPPAAAPESGPEEKK